MHGCFILLLHQIMLWKSKKKIIKLNGKTAKLAKRVKFKIFQSTSWLQITDAEASLWSTNESFVVTIFCIWLPDHFSNNVWFCMKEYNTIFMVLIMLQIGFCLGVLQKIRTEYRHFSYFTVWFCFEMSCYIEN